MSCPRSGRSAAAVLAAPRPASRPPGFLADEGSGRWAVAGTHRQTPGLPPHPKGPFSGEIPRHRCSVHPADPLRRPSAGGAGGPPRSEGPTALPPMRRPRDAASLPRLPGPEAYPAPRSSHGPQAKRRGVDLSALEAERTPDRPCAKAPTAATLMEGHSIPCSITSYS